MILKLRVIKLPEEQMELKQGKKEARRNRKVLLFITILMDTSAHTTVLFINLEDCENILIREYHI